MSLYDFEENSDTFEDEEVSETVDFKSDDVEQIEVSSEVTEEVEKVPDSEKDSAKKSSKKKSKKKKVKSFIKEVVSFVIIIIAAFVIAILINIYVIRTSHVEGPSMNPTLQNGQNVLISRMPYIFDDPKSGDIIVFDSSKKERTFVVDIQEALRDNALTKMFADNPAPVLEEQFYIKRVIGVAGDVLHVKDGIMYLNDAPLKNDGYSVNDDGTAYYSYEGMSWTVEEGYVFVMGDNRINSKDSRKIGCIPVDCIMGKVVKQ